MHDRRPVRRAGSMAVLCGVLTLSIIAPVIASEAEDVSFSADIQPMLNSQCVYCHVTGAENGGLNLGRRQAYAELLADSEGAPLPRVTPGDVEQSYLVHKLHGTHLEVGGNGSPMPVYDPPKPFPANYLKLVEAWIEAGAPDN